MTIIGIDPGANGGIAVLSERGLPLLVAKMPKTEREILDLLVSVTGKTREVRAFLERVHSSPQMGVVSVFTFGCGYGGLRMALTAADIHFVEVTPQRWQKVMGCQAGGEFGKVAGKKTRTKARAAVLFPELKVTNYNADALLIAEYGRRAERGMVIGEPAKAVAKRTRPAKTTVGTGLF